MEKGNETMRGFSPSGDNPHDPDISGLSGLPDGNGAFDLRFDRLVDGELSEPERRALLLGLDHEHEGWRRCALAFLEAQSWKEEFKAIPKQPMGNEKLMAQQPSLGVSVVELQKAEAEKPMPLANAAPRDGFVWRQRLSTALAMAASFLIALAIGSQFHRDGGAQPTGSVDPVALNNDSPHSGAMIEPTTLPMSKNGKDQWELVTLSAAQGQEGGQRTIRVPAVERSALDRSLYEGLPETVPPDVLQAMTRMGHEVRQQRELVPVPLDDGREMLVPVDRVELHYVGRPSL